MGKAKEFVEVRIELEEVVGFFHAIEDPRSSINRLHPFESVLVISIMGVLAGASGPTSIAEWARHKRDFLGAHLSLPHGIPGKDVFRRVLMALKPDAFQACFAVWLQHLKDRASAALDIQQPVLAIDGKTLRHSFDRRKGLGALHSVSIWASELGLSLGQVACEEKSNEITAIPEVLKLIDVRGAIITIDAMGTQKAIAKQIIDSKGDYVLALKGNQDSLHKAVVDYIDAQLDNDLEGVDAREVVTQKIAHGRDETRSYVQLPAPKQLPGFANWTGLATLCVVLNVFVENGKETAERRYFISSLPMGVKRIAHAIRSHWGIENSCHWCLDVTYREDDSRIREKTLRQNVAWLNRFTLSLLKQQKDKRSVAMRRRGCGWNDDYLMQVITGAAT